ncbi:3' terminal RNA ribose 2'-O-methyltransferase Hen1 [Amycolatopsis sp. H20-H5]|uniref:3' terminal RNA ribose 2'-O-methyltransferase Hen1 n=1 Tax=Amycolatopsis sp. H20-H5 TaxID=3046309 RepID=UPI002DB827C9|nr:3' terminal RNA ribose 2'-O-methyltransferase Hen1 [Amycolatopsis sp. H20-H5]MEC3979861.1 3' terminal RNA ribose 2'-O-methyltransferase Hen1 [Amycolatopsis sp. H20-H5]
MLLTITTTHVPATDLGFLLHKHPEKAQTFELAAGTTHVFYPRASEELCTAALLLEMDPIALVRGGGTSLTQYVNDRPYAAGSHLAVALRTVFNTAMAGRCDKRPELVTQEIPLEIHVPSLVSRGGPELVEKLFAPLGWQVEATPIALDAEVLPDAVSRYVDLRLTGTLKLSEALNHLYVLLPALDGDKHYWVGQDEAEKLLRAGEGWLSTHPERELITNRYLERRREYVNFAMERLSELDDLPEEPLDEAPEEKERRQPLAVQRQGSVLAALRAAGAHRVLDLGCGSGALLRVLQQERSFTEIVGLDVSAGALDLAEKRLKLGRLPEHQRGRLTLRQSALTYADPSLAGYDAAVLMEVIEHVDEERLPALEHAVFTVARPRTVIVTTPNAEYNPLFEFLEEGCFRHADHRFEWTREQFREWADGVASRRGYDVRYLPVGQEDDQSGPPTQMAVFTSREEVAA